MIKAIRFGMFVVFATAVGGAAEPLSSTSPAQTEPSRLRSEGRAARFPRFNQSVTDAEWKNILEWMKTYSSNRYHMLQLMQRNHNPRFPDAQRLAAQPYRQFQAMSGFPPLQAAFGKVVMTQDAIFNATVALRRARRQHDTRAEHVAASDLRKYATQLFDAQLEVKKMRVARLQQEIRRQEERRSELVENWYNRILGHPTQNDSISGTQEAAPQQDEQP